jgi:hypothetical protein
MSNTTFLQEPEPLDREQSIEAYLKLRLQSIDRAVAGYVSVSLQGLTGTVDLTPLQAKYRVVKLTGAPAGAVTLRIPHATGANADIIFVNTCTGSNSTVTLKSTGANAGNAAGVTLFSGDTRHVRHDGESVYAAAPATATASGASNPSGESVLGADFTLSAANGTYQDTGLSLSLPSAGTYRIYIHVRGSVAFSAGSLGFITAKLFNSTDGTDVANSETLVVVHDSTTGSNQAATGAAMLVTVAAAKTIKLYAKRDSATTWTTSSIRSTVDGRTRMSYEKLS